MSQKLRIIMDKIIDILDSIAYEKGLKNWWCWKCIKRGFNKNCTKMVDHALIFDAKIDRTNKN